MILVNGAAYKKRIVLVEAGIIILIFVLPLSATSLPHVTLPGVHALDASNLDTPPYAESNLATIFGLNNFSLWSLNPPDPSTASLNASTKALLLTGEFPASSTPIAVSIFRTISVNLTDYPILYMLVKVPTGTSYGIRFFSPTASHTLLPLWSETDALNHRAGTGGLENVQTDLLHLTEENTGSIVNRLAQVLVYVERGPSATPTGFSLQLNKFEFKNYPFIAAPSAGSYHAIYLTLHAAQNSPSTVLTSVQVGGRLNASSSASYVVYAIQGPNIYRGGVFTFDPSIPKEQYTISLIGRSPNAFSDKYPEGSFTIVIVMQSGTLYGFVPENITVNYFYRTAQTTSPPKQPYGLAIYLAFFLVLLPTAVIALLFGQLTRKKAAKPDL